MKEINTEAKLNKLNEIRDVMDQYLEELGCPMKVQIQLDIALEEIFVNIAHYAYKADNVGGPCRIVFDYDEEKKMFSMEFSDEGVPFDPLKTADPDTTLSVQERRIGGLGIFMVKKSMDDLQYRWEDGKNILLIRKALI